MWTFSFIFAVLGYGLLVNGVDNERIICPQGWVKIHRGCYKFQIRVRKWQHAKEFCNREQGSLIIIQSMAERDNIAQHLKHNYKNAGGYWLSGFSKENNVWKTIDNNPLRLKEMSWKVPKMATTRRLDCGMLQFDGTELSYASIKCNRRKPFICEYHPITSRPPTQPTTLYIPTEPTTTASTAKENLIETRQPAVLTKNPLFTTLSDSDVPVVFTITKKPIISPEPTRSSSTTGDDNDHDDDDDNNDDDNGDDHDQDNTKTLRVSRSTNGFGISQSPTKSPPSGEVDELDTYETTEIETDGKSATTDWESPKETEIPYTYVPTEDGDNTSEDGDGLKEEETNDNGDDNGDDSIMDKGQIETSPSTTATTSTQRYTTTSTIPRPTQYDWEEALEEFEGCYIPGVRETARAQVKAAKRLYQQERSLCPAVRVSRMLFPMSKAGEKVKIRCRKGRGFATFTCGSDPVCWRGQPDVTGCASPRFKFLLEKVKIDDEDEEEDGDGGTDTVSVKPSVVEPPVVTAEESVNVTSELVQVTETEDVSMEDIIVTSKVITAVTRKSKRPKVKRNKKQIKEVVENVVKAGSNLVSKKKRAVWKGMTREDKVRSASSLMVAMETATVSMAEEIEEPTVIKQSDENIEMEIQVVSMEDLELEKKEELVYDSSKSDSTFSIPMETLKDVTKGRLAKAVFMTHYSMADLMGSKKTKSDQDDSASQLEKAEGETVSYESVGNSQDDIQAEAKEEEVENEGPQLASYILSASLGVEMPMTKLSQPISFSMRHTVEIKVGYHVLCSFWNISEGHGIGFWSQEGCRIKKTNSSHTTCECDHMTNFAILLDVHNLEVSTMHQSALRLVTIIGCVISCASLIAAWVTFQCFTSLQGERTSIHKNLAVCLLLAEILFVAGVDQAKHQLACSVIAVFLHFFFLAAFSWMLLEGFHIIIMLIQVFDASRSRLPYYYLVGYGLPVVVVGISCLAYFPGYGTERFCWLTTERYFIWAFAGPVALILMVNAIFLTYALTTVCRHADYVFNPKDKTTGSGIRQWILGALALEVLLGLTWMFGYFLLSDAGLTLAYIFTILNSMQGLFIFIFHCLLNKKAQKEYRRVMRIPLTRSSSSAATQSTLQKRHSTRSHEMNHKQSLSRGNCPLKSSSTNNNSNNNGDVIA